MCCLYGTDTDDAPENGPQHYVVITGFYEPHLLLYLDEVGIAVDCLIHLTSTIPDSQLPAVGKHRARTCHSEGISSLWYTQYDKNDGLPVSLLCWQN